MIYDEKKIKARAAKYFKLREEAGAKVSESDFCAFLDISFDELREMAEDDNIGLFIRRALTKIYARIEMDEDRPAAMSTFMLKQGYYGFSPDKKDEGRVIVELKLDGI